MLMKIFIHDGQKPYYINIIYLATNLVSLVCNKLQKKKRMKANNEDNGVTTVRNVLKEEMLNQS